MKVKTSRREGHQHVIELPDNIGGGDSAYQVAVNNGFVGTEAEWLASLEGPDVLTPEMLAATNTPKPGFTLAYDSPGLFRWVDPDPPDLLNMKPFTDADLNLITKE